MGNNSMVVDERSRDIGRFLVGRLLPFSEKRQVGPFTFIDHMGPSEIGPGRFVDVDQHPHIGLSTLTYLIEGEMMHRDSTGVVQRILPGSVNWMVAGSGVTHTERTPEDLRGGGTHTLHGYQVWVALPTAQEEDAPHFLHVAHHELPSWEEGSVQCTLLAGEGFGRTAPNPIRTPLFMMEMKSSDVQEIQLNGQLQGELAIVVVKGHVIADNESLHAGQMLISKTDQTCSFTMGYDTHLLLFGGSPLPEERFLYWNFVSSSKERLEKAKQDWQAHAFPQVPDDSTYIPLPLTQR